jgi:peroxisomal 3,2-trans-enoyl-CoA isomerase
MKVGANDDPEELIRIFDEINRLIITCDKILIAAVNGPALGYGTTSLALYDLVYSVPHAYFTTPFSRWALCPEGCSSVTFPKIMGHHKAAALLLAGERMSAEELYTAGLITKIIEVPSDAEFIKKVLEIASRIASYPPVALRANKAVLSRARVPELLEANRAECEHLRERLNHQESKDAVKGFLAEQEQKRLAKVGKISKL